ncbi:MAG TPA: glycosyltransferase family 9 protein [Bryobacteraceae bacterium]|nr:glycosyltransferase family 9 protein [Bryobacteraceae bacterium]
MRRLLIRPGGIGDTILALPALECLQADYTEVWVRSDAVPLVRFADRVRSIASTGIDLLGLPEVAAPPPLIDTLRSFDSIVSWYGTNRGEFRDAVGTLRLPVRFLQSLPEEGAGLHAADFFLRQASCDGVAIPRIDCGRATRSNCAVIHPFSGSARKNWPMERFRDLAERLAMPVQWCAGPEEELDGAARFTDLYELARWLAQARIYIGNDSGISHLAAAAGAPVVAVFGPTDPAIWAPRGERVRVVSGKLEEITVEQVLSVVDWLK